MNMNKSLHTINTVVSRHEMRSMGSGQGHYGDGAFKLMLMQYVVVCSKINILIARCQLECVRLPILTADVITS